MKPTNCEGFDGNLGISKSMVVKYFKPGDAVKITEGRYVGETAIIAKIEDDVTMPLVRLNDTNRELIVSTSNLRMVNDQDKKEMTNIDMNQTDSN
jgi:transcription antitermination factor NusG